MRRRLPVPGGQAVDLGGTRHDRHRLASVARLARQRFPGDGVPRQLFSDGTGVIPGQVSPLTRLRRGKLNRLIFGWRVDGDRSGVHLLAGWLRFLRHGGRIPAERRDRLVLGNRCCVLKVVHRVPAAVRLVERGRAEVWCHAKIIRSGDHRLRGQVNPIRLSRRDILANRLTLAGDRGVVRGRARQLGGGALVFGHHRGCVDRRRRVMAIVQPGRRRRV
jgi:hypothetical protein